MMQTQLQPSYYQSAPIPSSIDFYQSAPAASVESRIHDAADRNSKLLTIVRDTDNATSALEQQQQYIQDLETALAQLTSRINDLATKRAQELKGHEKYRDSTMKRLAYRMSGKSAEFAARAEQEEREYFDALHEEQQAKKQQDSLRASLDAAQQQRGQLEVKLRHRSRALRDLDALYAAVFDGPTPGFPEEDACESACQSALQAYHDTDMALQSEQRALSMLEQARTAMSSSLHAVANSRTASQVDMFGGGRIADAVERNQLSKAERECHRAADLVVQAQRMSVHVRGLPAVEVAHGNFLGDVILDSPFSGHRFHRKIRQTQDELKVCNEVLEGELARAQQRVEAMRVRMVQEEKRLEDAKKNLQAARETAFEMVLSGSLVAAY